MAQRIGDAVRFSPLIIVRTPLSEVVQAASDILETAARVARVALLLDGDVALIGHVLQQLADAGIVDDPPADLAHHASGAGVKEPDPPAHDVVEDLPIDIFKVGIPFIPPIRGDWRISWV